MKEDKIKTFFDKNNQEDFFNVKTFTFNFKILKKPENYVRERSGRGRHFYNPKEDKMKEYKLECLRQLSKADRELINSIIKNNNEYYTVSIKATYYYPIPKGDNIKMSALKDAGIIDPTIKIDLDNYDKFLLDSLHGVLYDDDKHVVSIESAKKYSLEPRTEVEATIKEIIIK